MAVSISNLTVGSKDTSGTSATTASVTPSANKLQLLSITCRKDTSQPATPTISGNGLTWVLINTIYYDTTSGSRKSLWVFRAMGSSPSSGTITITFGETWTNCNWSLDEASGMDTSGTNGSGAIVQSATNKEDAGDGGILTVTLSAFASTNNATFGAFAGDPGTGTVTVGSGFTKLGTKDTATMNLGTEYKNSNDTSVDATFDAVAGTSSGGVAIEIKAGQSYTQSFSETVTPSEPSFVKAPTRTLSDTITPSDTIIKANTRSLSDTSTISDTISYIQGRFQTLSDTISISDTLSYLQNRFKTFSETITISDTLINSYVYIREYLDTSTISDTFATIRGFVLSDVINIKDWLWRWRRSPQILFTRVSLGISSFIKQTLGSSGWTEDSPDVTVINNDWS